MSFFVPERIDSPELLDDQDAPRADMERSLRDLRRFNRYMGGTRVYRKLLERFGRETDSLRILDLGTGSSDLLESIDGRALKVGVDFKIDHLVYGRDLRRRNGSGGRRISLIVADAMRLPFRSESVDVVTSSHFAHHFTPDENVTMMRDALRIARRGVFVSDTNRHRVPLLWVRLLALFRLVGRITRSDAPGSILRGYTPEEALRFARDSGASRIDVLAMWPFRTGIVLWK